MTRLPRGGGGGGRARAARAAHGVRRAWPYVLMAWERWQALPPERKERYKRQARDYAQRGRKLIGERRAGRPRRRNS